MYQDDGLGSDVDNQEKLIGTQKLTFLPDKKIRQIQHANSNSVH